MSASRPGAHRILLSAPVMAVAAAVLAGCGSSKPAAAPASATTAPASATTAPAAPSTTAAPATTTTVDSSTPPPDPQPSASQASAVFMDGWMAGDRARSATVATPAALATLYATAYAGQPLNDRGCTDAFPPIVCTWGPYAGGSGAIYQVQLTQQGSDWYVSGVTVLS